MSDHIYYLIKSNMYSDYSGGSFASVAFHPITLIIVGLLVLFIILYFATDLFKKDMPAAAMRGRPMSIRRRPKEKYIAGWLGASTQGRPTDYVADGRTYQNLDGGLLMPPHVAKSYQQLIHPPPTTNFVQSTQGGGSCAVSSVNNCPSDLYWKCEEKQWNKDAVGEALALSAVGSFYAASDVEDANLYKVVSLAHDPVSRGCSNAADLPAYTNSNPNLMGSAITS